MIKGISKLKKGMSYLIITFFVAIIIVAFIVPSAMKNSGSNSNVIAVVNGEDIYRADFARFMESELARYGMDSSQVNEQMQQYFLNSMIQQKMFVQLAYKSGVHVTTDHVKAKIEKIFTNEEGKFDNDQMMARLQQAHFTYDSFFSYYKDSLAQNEYSQLLFSGVGVSPDELNHADIVNNSNLKIKALYVSDADLKNILKDQIQVTDAEVAKALQDNPEEVKDPKTDKERMKQKLIDEKYGRLRIDFIKKVEDISKAGGDINQVFQLTGGTIVESNDFKIGGNISTVTESPVKLDELTANNTFFETFLKLNENQVSLPLESRAGFFVFTPLKKEIGHSADFNVADNSLGQAVQSEKMQSLQTTVITSFIEKSKVKRNN